MLILVLVCNKQEQFVVGCPRSGRKSTRLTRNAYLSLTISWFGYLQSFLLWTSHQHPNVCAMSGNNVRNNFLKVLLVLPSHCCECLH
jgi:hypothetical protein